MIGGYFKKCNIQISKGTISTIRNNKENVKKSDERVRIGQPMAVTQNQLRQLNQLVEAINPILQVFMAKRVGMSKFAKLSLVEVTGSPVPPNRYSTATQIWLNFSH